jgi:two-component system sensor histidine kinase DesK
MLRGGSLAYRAKALGAKLRWRTEVSEAQGVVRAKPEPRQVALGVHVAVACGIALLVVLHPAPYAAWYAKAAALGYAGLLVAAHFAGLRSVRFRRSGNGPALALAVQAGGGYLPALQLGPTWTVLSGFFAAGLLRVVRPARAVPVAFVVCLSAGVVNVRPWRETLWENGLAGFVGAAVVTLVLYGAAECARLAAERDDERRDLERRVMTEERERFSRDLHDLLGLSLSAITLKGEMISRLVDARPEQAKADLTELLSMSRKALADVREVAAGYRRLSLDDECRAASAVLQAAGIEPLVDERPLRLPPQVATMLSAVLREGVTNVMRHSRANWCRCRLRATGEVISLEVTNDGVAGSGRRGHRGSGLRNLRHRVTELGGELEAGVGDEGTHRLAVQVPISAPSSVRGGGN